MFRKLLTVLAINSILLVSNSLIFAQTSGDWSAVEATAGQEVAIKTRIGKMRYGVLKSADSTSLVLQVAGKKQLTQNEITINQREIKKVWCALLFINQKNTAKGAGIGAVVGAFALGDPTGEDSLKGFGYLIGAGIGGAIGGVVGFYSKKKHRKMQLVYKQ